MSSPLVEALLQAQATLVMTDAEFSRLLDIEQSTWYRIQQGLINPGGKTLKAIARELPSLRNVLMEHMVSSDGHNNDEEKEDE